MAFKSKYKGIEIENLLDLVAAGNSGSVGDFSLYLTKEEAESLYAKSNNSFVVANGIIDNEGVSYFLPTSDSEDLQHVLSTKWDIEQLSDVAKSGSYTDLINTPDLITEIKMNGVVKGTSGSIDLGTVITDVSGKVDKVLGKDLSTHDFTTELKTKLEGLSNYDDYELSMAISQLRTDFDQLVSGDTTTAIKTFNEIIAFLDGISDTQDLDSILASIEQQIASKQAIISDLDAIRSGANKGETSVQPSDISDFLTVDDIAQVATSGSYNDLTDKPTIPSSVTESTVSGWGFTKNAGTVTGVKINGTTKSPTSGVVDLGTVITSHQDVSGKQDKLVSGTNIKTINGTSILGSGDIVISGGSIDTSDCVKVILGARPHTPNADGEVDLSADFARIIKVNGLNYTPTQYGEIDLGTVITAHQTLKTINGQSIVGSGNITISGGSGGSSDANVQAIDTGDVLDDVTVNYATTSYVDGLVGDINSVLESIISGGVNTQQENLITYKAVAIEDVYNCYFCSEYPVESDITITADWYHPINGDQTLVYHISKGNTETDEKDTFPNEFTNVVITPESDSKYIYVYNS